MRHRPSAGRRPHADIRSRLRPLLVRARARLQGLHQAADAALLPLPGLARRRLPPLVRHLLTSSRAVDKALPGAGAPRAPAHERSAERRPPALGARHGPAALPSAAALLLRGPRHRSARRASRDPGPHDLPLDRHVRPAGRHRLAQPQELLHRRAVQRMLQHRPLALGPTGERDRFPPAVPRLARAEDVEPHLPTAVRRGHDRAPDQLEAPQPRATARPPGDQARAHEGCRYQGPPVVLRHAEPHRAAPVRRVRDRQPAPERALYPLAARTALRQMPLGVARDLRSARSNPKRQRPRAVHHRGPRYPPTLDALYRAARDLRPHLPRTAQDVRALIRSRMRQEGPAGLCRYMAKERTADARHGHRAHWTRGEGHPDALGDNRKPRDYTMDVRIISACRINKAFSDHTSATLLHSMVVMRRRR
ncbi:hypothetical protein CALCODRAFT_340824 [Calocera cornea HHB12733]|uniref:Uncharacterized protein n=1 Tax=Calocera cornea HHB12733 TaxID=1353952 RepID=A0A165EXX8_9BASI|nr:hypothetical protein CALCODRAFT_340824 [Calocera cornea HHB12733]